MNNRELHMLEKLLCSSEEPPGPIKQSSKSSTCEDIPDLEEFVHNFYTGYPNCKDFIVDFYTVTKNTGNNMDEVADDVVQILEEEESRLTEGNSDQEDEECRETTRADLGPNRLNISANVYEEDGVRCNSDARTSSERESVGDEVHYHVKKAASSSNSSRYLSCEDSPCSRRIERTASPLSVSDSIAEQQAAPEGDDISDVSEARRRRSDEQLHAKQQQDEFITSDISEILGSSDNIEIPQTQYLLNQVSHENNVTGETVHIQNSLPDLDSKKLISEANKTLSNLLLDGECQNEISEQTDSGICTVISSENTSLYDKSPEEKKTFANEIQQDGHCLDDEDTQENTSYSCSNLNSPKRKSSTISDNSCVCSLRSVKTVASSLDHSIEVLSLIHI